MATYADISGLQIERWSPRWEPGFLKSSRQKEAEHTADSVKRNLTDALPSLISDVRTNHGSVSSTFRLYHDLTLVGEAMDMLVSSAKYQAKKVDTRALVADGAALSRIRANLSAYIEVKAAAMDSKAASYASYNPARQPRPSPFNKIVIDDMSQAAPPAPKKIIVDDDAPEVPIRTAPRIVASRELVQEPAPTAKKITVDDDPVASEQPDPTALSGNSVSQPPATQLPKKIIIDDNIPAAKPARKKQ
jgi:hypothetical protein